MLGESNLLKKDIHNLDISTERRHVQVLQRLDQLSVTDVRGAYYVRIGRQSRIKQLCDRLWFDAIPWRHHAIKTTHNQTFEGVFTGQKTTAQSSTTFLEWMMNDKAGLYWVSGWAGTGKSCFFRFLDDDPRTEIAFQEWAGERELVLATFYFLNSEAANDDRLKSLSGLYQGILYRPITECSEFTELLFPDHFVDERPWGDDFPTISDMGLAFERLVTAVSLPVAVGLIIDGLDEYDAENRQQMAMTETLRRASQSPHLKVIVSS